MNKLVLCFHDSDVLRFGFGEGDEEFDEEFDEESEETSSGSAANRISFRNSARRFIEKEGVSAGKIGVCAGGMAGVSLEGG